MGALPVPPPRGPGETLQAYMARLDEWSKDQGSTGPARGGPTALLPGGQWSGTPNAPGSVYKVQLSDGTFQTHTVRPDGSLDTVNTAVSPRTPGSTTDYNAQKTQQQLAGGGRTSPDPNWLMHPGGARAIDPATGSVWQRFDTSTNVWTNNGTVFNPRGADALWVAQAMHNRSTSPTSQTAPSRPATGSSLPTPSPSSTPTPGAFNPLSAPPLGPNNGPYFASFNAYTQPGNVPSSGDYKSMRTGSEMNTLFTSDVRPNGPQIQGGVNGLRPVDVPGNRTPGIPNTYARGGGLGGAGVPSTVDAQFQFPSMNFGVPNSYSPGASGFTLNTGQGGPNPGAFQAFGIPFNISSPSLDSLSPGGSGMLQLSGPQTAEIRGGSQGFGFNPSMFGATYGRELGGPNRDAATQAVEALALINAQNLGYGPALTQPDPGSNTGQPGLYGHGTLPGGWLDTNGDGIPDGVPVGGVGPDSGSYGGGYGPDGGTRFAGGGVITARPLGAASSGPKSMVTPEQIYLVGNSGKVYGTVGEDNSDPNSAPNPELLSFPNNDQMKVTPLTPAFADGGWITSGGMGGWGNPTPQPQPAPEPVQPPPVIVAPSFSGGMGSSGGGFGQSVQPVPSPSPVPVPVPTYAPPPIDTVTPTQPSAPVSPPFVPHLDQPVDPGSGFGSFGGGFSQPTNPVDQPSGGLGPSIPVAPTQPTSGFGGPVPTGGLGGPGTPVPVPTTPTPTTPTTPAAPVTPPSFNPLPVPVPNGQAPTDLFDPNILLPWQQAAQRLALQAGQRSQYDYRRRAAGLGSATAIPVLSGDVPNQELPPGMYYDPSGQVNRVTSDILGTQSEIQALGPTEDITPVQQQVSDIGHYLDAMQKIRDLELQRTGAEANAAAPNQTADTSNLQAELNALQQRASDAYQTTPPGPARDAYLADLARQEAALQRQIDSAQNNVPQALDRVSVINSEIAALQSSLPANTSEAALLTELARAKERLSRNDRRLYLSQQAQNLSKLGVPNLTSPIAA